MSGAPRRRRATKARRAIATVIVALGLAVDPVVTALASQTATPVHTIEARVSMPPVTVRVDGRSHLVHELHLTNLRREPVVVSRVTVRGGASTPLVDLTGAALTAAFVHAGVARESAVPPTLPPGRRAVVYLWAPLPSVPPTHVTHDIDIAAPSAVPPLQTVVTTAPAAVVAGTQDTFGPPLSGGPWIAVYDPLLMGGHRTTFVALDGVPRIPARFAIDWIRAPEQASPAPPNTAPLNNGYGSEVLAVADGVVVHRRDGVADQPAGVSRTPVPLPLAEGSGNHVVLDVGGGRFAIYEHLRQGSVRVQVGDRVRRGQVIAGLGSSGSTSIGPHLHFHVADAGSTLAAEGVPWHLDQFELLGRYASIDALMRGEAWASSADAGVARRRELPPAMAVVRFAPVAGR